MLKKQPVVRWVTPHGNAECLSQPCRGRIPDPPPPYDFGTFDLVLAHLRYFVVTELDVIGRIQAWKEADVVFLQVPLLPATKHIFNEDVLPKLKKGMILINTSRGGERLYTLGVPRHGIAWHHCTTSRTTVVQPCELN